MVLLTLGGAEIRLEYKVVAGVTIHDVKRIIDLYVVDKCVIGVALVKILQLVKEIYRTFEMQLNKQEYSSQTLNIGIDNP